MKDSSTPPSRDLAVLVVGNPGTGKSRLGFAWANPGILDIDLNLESALRVSPGKKYKYSQPLLEVKLPEQSPAEDMEQHRWRCSSLLWTHAMKESKLLVTDPGTDCLFADGLTKLAEWGLDHCRWKLQEAGINLKKEYLAPYASFIPLLSGYITTMRMSRKPIIFTVHQTVDQVDITKAWYYSLAIPGQLKDRLGGLFTDVWGTSTETVGDCVSYFINTRPTNLHVGLKTSQNLEPKINVTGKTPGEIRTILAPFLSINVKQTVPPTAGTSAPGTVKA